MGLNMHLPNNFNAYAYNYLETTIIESQLIDAK